MTSAVTGAMLQLRSATDVRGIVSAMRDAHADVAVQHAGCLALKQLLLTDTDAIGVAAAAGAVGVLMAALEEHRTSAGVQEEGFGLIAALIAPSNREQVMNAGAASTAVSALQAHPTNCSVHVGVFKALRALIVDAKSTVRALAAGVAEAVLTTLRADITAWPAAVREALAVLSKLVEGQLWGLCQSQQHGGAASVSHELAFLLPSAAVDEEAGARLLRLSVIPAIVAAMQAHPSDAGVQMHACRALMLLFKSWPVADTFIAAHEASTLGAVQAALRTHFAGGGRFAEQLQTHLVMLLRQAALLCSSDLRPLVDLKLEATKADRLGRTARTKELYTRALKLAEASQPADSIITARLLDLVIFASANEHRKLHNDYWADDAPHRALSQRCLELLQGRWRAGTLLALTPDEDAYLSLDGATAYAMGAELYASTVMDAYTIWQPPRTAEERRSRLHAVYGALRGMLELDARGYFQHCPETGMLLHSPRPAMQQAMSVLLDLALDTSDLFGVAEALRRVHLSAVEEAALRDLARRFKYDYAAHRSNDGMVQRTLQARGEADVARHGLRACALPECAATEPQPKTFKLCARCQRVVYCCKEHQTEDWRRHKRADGCKK
jgi:hypothetical protein